MMLRHSTFAAIAGVVAFVLLAAFLLYLADDSDATRPSVPSTSIVETTTTAPPESTTVPPTTTAPPESTTTLPDPPSTTLPEAPPEPPVVTIPSYTG